MSIIKLHDITNEHRSEMDKNKVLTDPKKLVRLELKNEG